MIGLNRIGALAGDVRKCCIAICSSVMKSVMSAAVFAVIRFHFVMIQTTASKMAGLPSNRYFTK